MNRLFLKHWSFIISIALLGAMSACSDDDPPLPDNTINFVGAAEVGFDDDETEKTFTIALDRATTEASSITVNFTATGVTYGQHFTSTPAALGTAIIVPVPANSTEVSFKVSKVAGLLLESSAVVDFTLGSAADPLVPGSNVNAVKLSFASIVSKGEKAYQINGEIADASGYSPKSVYVDFSSNAQTSIVHTSYDLAFYSGAEFRVMLNYTSNATALALDKTDIDAVTAADASGKNLTPGPGATATIGLYDAWTWTSDLTKTVIGEVSATEADNKVYLFKPTTPTGDGANVETWYKIRVLRATNGGYTLQYARLNETTHTTIHVPKNTEFNFNFVSLASGSTVSVEPRKASWDIVWGYAAYFTATYAYAFNDMILINNTANVTAVKVAATANLTYESFTESNLAGLEFSNKRDVIGSTWRTTGGGVVKNQFYIVKDGAGNYYKLNVVSMGLASDGGTRGKPVIQYALVKKAG